MSNYQVITRDVDGSTRRTYKTIDKAMARFADMAGHSLESAIAEQYHAAATAPTVRAVKSCRTVSDYGTVVIFARLCEPEAEPVAAPAVSLAAQIEELREAIDSASESIADRDTQYRSECALYGDAGFGQHPSCWKPQAMANLEALQAELNALLDTDTGRELVARERAEAEAYLKNIDCPF